MHRILKTFVYSLCHPREVYRLVYSSKIQYPSLYARLTSDQNDKKTLDMLGKIHATDKASAMIKDSHFDPMHDYLRQYEIYFNYLRDEKIRLLEFGCQGGNSLRAWYDYFQEGRIYGVDLNPECKRFENDRTKVVIGNAVGDDTYSTLAEEGKFDIIIDDASHAWGEQRYSLEKYWNLLEEGGYYIVEDLECGVYGEYYNKGYVPEIIDEIPFSEYALNISRYFRWQKNDLKGNRKRAWEEYSNELKNVLDSLDMITFSPSIIIFRKKKKEWV